MREAKLHAVLQTRNSQDEKPNTFGKHFPQCPCLRGVRTRDREPTIHMRAPESIMPRQRFASTENRLLLRPRPKAGGLRFDDWRGRSRVSFPLIEPSSLKNFQHDGGCSVARIRRFFSLSLRALFPVSLKSLSNPACMPFRLRLGSRLLCRSSLCACSPSQRSRRRHQNHCRYRLQTRMRALGDRSVKTASTYFILARGGAGGRLVGNGRASSPPLTLLLQSIFKNPRIGVCMYITYIKLPYTTTFLKSSIP